MTDKNSEMLQMFEDLKTSIIHADLTEKQVRIVMDAIQMYTEGMISCIAKEMINTINNMK